ncbi:MAG: hypothetical protein R3F62_19465 [Planctomycetota bacterium]
MLLRLGLLGACAVSVALGAPEVYALRGVRGRRAFAGTLSVEGGGFQLVRRFADGAEERWRGRAQVQPGSLVLLRDDTPTPRTYVYLDDPAPRERGFYRQRGVDHERLVATADLPEAAPRLGCVLLVEDEGWGRKSLTEPLGARLYGDLLRSGAYATVRVLEGRADGSARLAATLRELARDHDRLDVFLSIHTTHRDAARWPAQLGDEVRGKLRLVYSTACEGAQVAREAWERAGAQAVVTHVGTNNPVIALPYVLSEWVRGRPLGQAVRAGYRKTVALEQLVHALPQAANLTQAMIPARESQPVLSGDAELRIASGRAYARSFPPLGCFDPRTGALGVALETLGAAGYVVEGEQLRQARALAQALPAGLADAVLSIEALPDGARLRLREAIAITLYGALGLRLEPTTTLRVRACDLERGWIELAVDGVSGTWRGVSFRARGFDLRRLPLLGWVVTVKTRAAPIPIPVGGSAPARVPADVDAVYRPLPRR